jgi:glutamate carboxypeptidase
MKFAAAAARWVDEHRSNLLADLTDYVNIETPSDDKTLLDAGLVWLEAWLESRLGLPMTRRLVPGGAHGDTIVLDYPAVEQNAPWTTVLCHYDTVWAAGTTREWSPSIDGDVFRGPGAFDMKSGLVQFVWAVRACAALNLQRPNLRLILNGDEEIGSPASRQVIEDEVVRGDTVLVFEGSADGAIKTARKGVGLFQVQAHGEEAHAGLNPKAGASAVDEIARVVLQLHDAVDVTQGTSVNVGVVHGGTRTNVRAKLATAAVDVRISSESEAARIDSVFASLSPFNPKATLSVSGGWNRPVMVRSDQIADLFAMAVDVARDLGFVLEESSVGGASDGNFAAALGLPVLDGLGAVGGGAHSRGEWLSIAGMVERTALATGVLGRLARVAADS